MGGWTDWCGRMEMHTHTCLHLPSQSMSLVGAFSPFTFKVIIYMYDSIVFFLIVLGLFSVGLFLLLCSLPREVPLVFFVKLVWWCWILLTFACLESFWFLHQIWIRVLPDCGFSPLVIWNISCHSFLACRTLFSN